MGSGEIPGGGTGRRPRHWKRKLDAIRQEYQVRLELAKTSDPSPAEQADKAGVDTAIHKSTPSPILAALVFLGTHLFSWYTIALLVPSLWGFATVMLQVGIPTFVDVFTGEALFVSANILLLFKIVRDACRHTPDFTTRIFIAGITALVLGCVSWIGVDFAEDNDLPRFSQPVITEDFKISANSSGVR